MFDHQVTLNWNVFQNKKKWSIGAMCSKVVNVLLAFTIVYYMYLVFSHKDLNIKKQNTSRSIDGARTPLELIDKDIGSFIALQSKVLTQDTSKWITQYAISQDKG